ncbi:hypothetical protein HanPI659440_Chr03g0100801 [Helianthus annuus]|nr:hypothetical protein HanPI659440_Chr03g0100801 [Helianthus annuus]
MVRYTIETACLLYLDNVVAFLLQTWLNARMSWWNLGRFSTCADRKGRLHCPRSLTHCSRSVNVSFVRRVGGHAHVVTISGTIAGHVSLRNSFFLIVIIQLPLRIYCDEYIRGNRWFPLTCSKFHKFLGERKKAPSSSPINCLKFLVRFPSSSRTRFLFSISNSIMAEPSNPHNVEGENPDHSSPAAVEEDEDDGGAPGGGLPVLKWSKGQFETLITSIQMPKEFGAIYPQESDTSADAPAGCLTLWAEFFYDGNLRLPLTVFVAKCWSSTRFTSPN